MAAPGLEVSDPQGSHPSRGKGGRERLHVRRNHIRKGKAFTGAKSGWLEREQREQWEQRAWDGSRLHPWDGDVPVSHRDEQLGFSRDLQDRIFAGMFRFPPHSCSTRRSRSSWSSFLGSVEPLSKSWEVTPPGLFTVQENSQFPELVLLGWRRNEFPV